MIYYGGALVYMIYAEMMEELRLRHRNNEPILFAGNPYKPFHGHYRSLEILFVNSIEFTKLMYGQAYHFHSLGSDEYNPRDEKL